MGQKEKQACVQTAPRKFEERSKSAHLWPIVTLKMKGYQKTTVSSPLQLAAYDRFPDTQDAASSEERNTTISPPFRSSDGLAGGKLRRNKEQAPCNTTAAIGSCIYTSREVPNISHVEVRFVFNFMACISSKQCVRDHEARKRKEERAQGMKILTHGINVYARCYAKKRKRNAQRTATSSASSDFPGWTRQIWRSS